MWRKPNEVKPSSQPTPMPAQTSAKLEETPKISVSQPLYQPAPPIPMPAPVSVAPPVSANASRISSGLKISGELSGDSDLYIDGNLQGKVRLAGSRVTVGPNGQVQAEIDARQISVEGSVQGNLKGSEIVHLGGSSRVVGSITAPRIGIDDGARLRGKIETVRAPQPAKSSSLQAPELEDLHTETVGAKTE
jgi:cytoskeletal protein CcmA (bactofilin family)